MLYKRYSSPMSLLENMLYAGNFSKWVLDLVKAHNKDMEEKAQWEYYLHKVGSMSFEEFQAKCKEPVAEHDNIETTVKKSLDLLENFNI